MAFRSNSFRSALSTVLVSALLSAGLSACEAGQDPTTTGVGTGGGEGGSGGAGSTSSTTTSSGDGGATSVTVGSGSTGTGGASPIAEVFGHSATTLYRLDPETTAVTVVGPFGGCDDDVIDIAIDKDSNLYGTTTNRPVNGDPIPTGGLWRIDKNTAACTLVARGDFPNSLSFVPEGTLDADEEALVGYVGRNYVRIDTLGGEITTVAPNALPTGLESSGDIVSVIDGPTYLTVKGTGCDETDCVVAVNPSTGAAEGNLGSAGFDRVFGVAFWAGSLYGFTAAGDLFEFVLDEDGGITTSPLQVKSGLEFYGAGSTTAAPPTNVPN